MYTMGEMTCFAPNIGGFIEMGTKYVDPAFGFMMGINYLLQTGLTFPTELTAISMLTSYWDTNPNHSGAYITAALLITLAMNVVGVKL
jgi:amino acid transporter